MKESARREFNCSRIHEKVQHKYAEAFGVLFQMLFWKDLEGKYDINAELLRSRRKKEDMWR